MVYRSQQATKFVIGCGLVLAATVAGGLIGSPAALAAGVPPAFTQGFSEIVKKVTPAVVNIAVTGGGGESGRRRGGLPPGGPFGGPPNGGEEPGGGDLPTPPPMPPGPPGGHGRPEQSAGSGVILDPNGYIVTNNHVVEGATQITVTLSDRREFTAKTVGTDPKTDLAVIKIDAKDLPSLKWADYEKLAVGDLVLAVGSPFGLSSTVTLGIISALGRGNVGIADYEDFIQTDAAINPGNSGGALVNMNGELMGINTAIFSRTGGSEGIGFAIPSSIAVDIVDSLQKTGKVVRGWMGVAIQEITPALAKSFKLPEQRKGVLISDVNENGPSAAAGMKRGDVVIAFNGKEVQSVSQLRNLVARTMVGKDAQVKVLRDGKEQTVSVVVEAATDLGRVRVRRGPSEAILEGIGEGSPIHRAGLQSGDVLLAVNGTPIGGRDEARRVLAALRAGDAAELRVKRKDTEMSVKLVAAQAAVRSLTIEPNPAATAEQIAIRRSLVRGS